MKAFLFVCLACISLLSPSTQARSAADASDASGAVEAVWRVQSFRFTFGGYTASYSCNSLARRIRSVLTIVGVTDTLRIQMIDCTDLNGGASMHITLASPVEATPRNVQTLTTYDTRDELIAKLRDEQLATAADLERFPAVWTTVSLSKRLRPRLEPGDCELIRQLRRDVLPRLSVRVVSEDLHCSSGGFTRFTPPRLSVSALVAVPDFDKGHSLTSAGL